VRDRSDCDAGGLKMDDAAESIGNEGHALTCGLEEFFETVRGGFDAYPAASAALPLPIMARLNASRTGMASFPMVCMASRPMFPSAIRLSPNDRAGGLLC
jgi:hypothetical protein